MPRKPIVTGALLMAVALPTALAAYGAASLKVQPGSSVRVEGGSTVRSWRCEATDVGGSVTAGAAATELEALQAAVRGGEVSVPVAALDCGNGQMNGHMRKALKAEQNPTLRFRMRSLQLAPRGSEGTARMDGTLAIAGQERPVRFDGQVVRAPDGALRVTGSKEIRMTEWGVEPPRLMMGTLKVHDPVTISYEVVLKP